MTKEWQKNANETIVLSWFCIPKDKSKEKKNHKRNSVAKNYPWPYTVLQI